MKQAEYITTTNELREYLESIISEGINTSRTKQAEFNYIRKLYKKFNEVNHLGFTEKDFVEAYYGACMDLMEWN